MKPGIALAALLIAPAARGAEGRVSIPDGPGAELVRARCAICHSLDYIQMNSPFLARGAWEAEVRKMIKVMGAPVTDAEVGPIVGYLSSRYGAP